MQIQSFLDKRDELIPMKKNRFTEARVIVAQRYGGGGKGVPCRQPGISNRMLMNWHSRYGVMS
jgi:hypothetical protein